MPEHLISQDEASEDLLAAAAYLAETIKSGDGHAEAMKSIVPLYLSKGDVDIAAEIANTVGDPFTRDRLLTLVAEKCAELDDDEYAIQLAEAIEDHGMQAEAMERVALQKTTKGHFEKAEQVAAGMRHPDFVYAGIAAKKAADGDESGAAEELGKVEYPAAAVQALQTMAALKITGSDADGAAVLLDQAVAAAGEIDHAEEKIRALAEIAYNFVETNRRDRAIEIFDAARTEAEQLDNVHRDNFLASVALGFMHAGNVEMADSTLDSVADKTQIASALLGFARELWKRDEKDDALEALDEAYSVLRSQRESETRSTAAKMGLFTSIAAQFAGFEKGERGIEIAEGIIDDAERMSALTQIAQVLTTRKQDELARQALNAIPDDGQRVFALLGMSDAANKNGDRDRAISLLNEAANLAETVPQLSIRSSAYNEMIRRFSEYGEAARASEMSHANVAAIASIRDESIRATLLAGLSELFASSGMTPSEKEWEIVRTLIRKADLGMN